MRRLALEAIQAADNDVLFDKVRKAYRSGEPKITRDLRLLRHQLAGPSELQARLEADEEGRRFLEY